MMGGKKPGVEEACFSILDFKGEMQHSVKAQVTGIVARMDLKNLDVGSDWMMSKVNFRQVLFNSRNNCPVIVLSTWGS